jgi:hypothetical protein
MKKSVVKLAPTVPDTQRGTKQISLFLQVALLDKAKAVAEEMTSPGMRVQYTDVVRMCLELGIPLLRKGKGGSVSLLEEMRLASIGKKIEFEDLVRQTVKSGLLKRAG